LADCGVYSQSDFVSHFKKTLLKIEYIDKATQSMIDNLYKNGKTLQEWIEIVTKKFEKLGQIIKLLKEQHDYAHVFANFVAYKQW